MEISDHHIVSCSKCGALLDSQFAYKSTIIVIETNKETGVQERKDDKIEYFCKDHRPKPHPWFPEFNGGRVGDW
jgi:hypothetical protein